MAPALMVSHSLRVGEELAIVLGFGLSTVAVAMRLWVKARLTKTMLLEDYFSLAAWLSFLTYIGLAIVIGTSGGDAVHKAYLSSVESTIYCPIVILVKVSILLQYITIFVVHRGGLFHIMVHVLLWTNVVFYIIIAFLVTFECSPRAKAWDETIPGSCFSVHQLGVSSGVINLVSDFAILLLPARRISRLQMPWTKKWRIVAVFAVGSLACVAAVFRLVYSIQLTNYSSSASPEQQLVTDKKGLWAFAEIAVGIIVGCMPVLPRFFKQPIFTSLGSWSGRKSEGRSSETSRRSLRQRLFGKHFSGEKGSPLDSLEASQDSDGKGSGKRKAEKVAGKSFHGIETQNLTRASIDLSGIQLPTEPSPVHSKDGLVSLTALPQYPRKDWDKSLPDLPQTVEDDRPLQETTRIEKAKPWNRNR